MSEKLSESKAHDRAVLTVEVMALAKKQCQWCCGKGLRRRVLSDRGSGSVRRGQTVTRDELCPCALNRFTKIHRNEIVTQNGAVYWATGKAPELPATASVEASEAQQ